MSNLRRLVASSNALFVFEAAARNGSFTRAAAELNVTQPAISRMLSRFEQHLGVSLFERTPKGATLTLEGHALFKRVSEGFRIIEAGLQSIGGRSPKPETVTLSVSSAFTTHWLMPRIDRFQRRFPTVDLRFQLIAGSLRGPVENVDLGMRFVESNEMVPAGAHVLNEIMVPVCSPAYLKAARRDPTARANGNTVIQLSDSSTDWAGQYAPFKTGRMGLQKTLTFSDYAVVIQAALLSQGIAFGWLTVVSHALTTNALTPAASVLTRTQRRCVLLGSPRRPLRPIVAEIRTWFIEELHREIKAIDEAHPSLGVRTACI